MKCIVCYVTGVEVPADAVYTVAGYSVCEEHVDDAVRAGNSGLSQVAAWIRQEKEAAEAVDEGNEP